MQAAVSVLGALPVVTRSPIAKRQDRAGFRTLLELLL